MWSRPSCHVFQSFCDQQRRCQRKCKSHPGYIPLPELSPPDEWSRGRLYSRRTRYEYHGDDKSDDRWPADYGACECSHGDRIGPMRVGDTLIAQRECMPTRGSIDASKATSNSSNYTVNTLVGWHGPLIAYALTLSSPSPKRTKQSLVLMYVSPVKQAHRLRRPWW